MRRLPIVIGLAVVALVIIFSSMFVVNEREQAIVKRFGEITRTISDPGLYFKVPTNFVDSTQIVEDRLLRFDLDNIRVQVADGKFYIVDAFMTYRIKNLRQFFETVSGSEAVAEQRLQTRLDAALRRVYGQRGFEAALSEERAAMMREVRDQIRPEANQLGLAIEDVRIVRTDLSPEVRQQTFQRMTAERQAEAAELRALGTQEKLRIEAEADRKATVLVAEAQRDAEILRGQGDGERNRIFAAAFQRDPEFFQFYRSMIAYEAAIEGSGTTMLLTPDSDFFRFFRDSSGLDRGQSRARGASEAAGGTPKAEEGATSGQ